MREPIALSEFEMSITIGKKQFRLTNIVFGGVLLATYFTGLSVLGVGLALPIFALWLMWTLTGIKSGFEKQKEEMEKIAAR